MISNRLTYHFGISNLNRIIFFGSGKVAYPTLKFLHLNYSNLQVVTQSSIGQRKIFNEIQNYSTENKLNWSAPITSKDSKQKRFQEWSQFLGNLGEPDFGVICSYGYMLPARLIEKFKNGLIVIHPSLLPKYRGGSPIFHAIANGQSISGVSYIEISKGVFDQGRILHQIQSNIGLTDSYDIVQKRLAEDAANNLSFVLENIDTLRPGKSQQESSKDIPVHLLKAPLIKSKKLDLNMPAEKVYHWSRALMAPKLYFSAKENDIILKLSNQYQEGDGQIGTFRVAGKKLFVRCLDKFIRVSSWYQPTKKQLPPGIFIAEFIKSGKYPAEKIRVQ